MSTLLNQFELVYVPFGLSNMHSTLAFCLRTARKGTNVPLQVHNTVAWSGKISEPSTAVKFGLDGGALNITKLIGMNSTFGQI